MAVIGAIVARILDERAPVALELQWALVEDDLGNADWALELHVIVVGSGPEHSDYTTICLHVSPAETLAEREAAHALAAAVVDRTGLPLHAPPVEQRGGQGGSTFLRAHPPEAPRGYPFTWSAAWWTDDGRRRAASGAEQVSATSGTAARDALARRLAADLPQRPLTLEISGIVRTNTTFAAPALEASVLHDLRLGARAGTPSAVARGLHGASPLALMIAFAAAFGGREVEFTPLADWRAGRLDDAGLDAALDALVPGRRREWERPLLLAERHQAGEGIASFLRDEHRVIGAVLPLIRDVRQAFGLGLGEAACLVEDALAGREVVTPGGARPR